MEHFSHIPTEVEMNPIIQFAQNILCLSQQRALISYNRFQMKTSATNSGIVTAQHGYPLPGFLLEFAIRTDTEKIMPSIAAELARR